MAWHLTNGLVLVVPAAEAGRLLVLSWGASAWESPTELSLVATATVVQFSGVSLLRNSPEATTLRVLAVADNTEMATLDLTVRRGDRNVHGLLKTEPTGLFEVSAPGAATTITGAARLTSNDADGNRWVLSSALGTPDVSGTGGLVGFSSGGNLLDFGIAHEIGGSGASGIETAQALANQYAAIVSERVDVVAP